MKTPVNNDLRTWFRLARMPFGVNVPPDDMYLRQSMIDVSEKIRFAIDSELFFMLIGDVGSGKTSTLSYAVSKLNGKRYEPVRVIAGAWSFTELLRQCMASLGIFTRTSQQATMLRQISEAYSSIRESGKTPVMFIDEASLLLPEVFQQIHLLGNQAMSTSGKTTPLVLCGQEALFEKANNAFCRPFMSRVIDGYQLRGLSMQESNDYIDHQLYDLCKGPEDIFDENAKKAVFQATGGIPRRINEMCLKAMKLAMDGEHRQVTPELVRLAARNWWE